MGLDANARMALGFEVSKKDFLTTLKPKSQSCPEGHAKTVNSRAKYCPECGGKFDFWPIFRLTDTGKKLIEVFGFDTPTDTTESEGDDDGNDITEGEWSSSEEDEINVWWNHVQHCRPFVRVGVDEDILILGLNLADSGSLRGNLTTETLTKDQMDDAWKDVEDTRKALGLGDRPIRVYVWLYVSS